MCSERKKDYAYAAYLDRKLSIKARVINRDGCRSGDGSGRCRRRCKKHYYLKHVKFDVEGCELNSAVEKIDHLASRLKKHLHRATFKRRYERNNNACGHGCCSGSSSSSCCSSWSSSSSCSLSGCSCSSSSSSSSSSSCSSSSSSSCSSSSSSSCSSSSSSCSSSSRRWRCREKGSGCHRRIRCHRRSSSSSSCSSSSSSSCSSSSRRWRCREKGSGCHRRIRCHRRSSSSSCSSSSSSSCSSSSCTSNSSSSCRRRCIRLEEGTNLANVAAYVWWWLNQRAQRCGLKIRRVTVWDKCHRSGTFSAIRNKSKGVRVYKKEKKCERSKKRMEVKDCEKKCKEVYVCKEKKPCDDSDS